MILRIFCIRDRAADAFGQPMFFQSRGGAIRSFSDEVNNQKRDSSQISLHPEDFELFEIGSWNDQDCTFDLSPRPVQCAVGKDLLVKQ
ncbi:MAG: nonstructural protein [Microvirus sp.]|nr:MAG: nonstructural protein [Microvirus sp.]